MNGLRRLYLTIFALLFIGAVSMAVTYRTPELRRLAGIIGVSEGKLRPGVNHIREYIVSVDKDMTVRHVGLALFSEEVKDKSNRLVLEFAERYFLQLEHPAPHATVAMMLRSDGVSFPKGNWHDIRKINSDTPFKLDYHLMRYTLSWQTKGATLSFSFPGKYQLIRGENLPEAEGHLVEDIKKTMCSSHPNVRNEELRPSTSQGFFIRRGGWFYAETINATTYYRRKKDGLLIPVIDPDLLEESVANIMLCPNAAESFSFDVTMHGYGYKDSRFSIPVHQWIDFCIQEGCDLYCGIEKVSTSDVRATVLAVNQQLNFNHLLTVSVPISAIENARGVVKAELNAFIPTHNIINFRGQPRPQMKKGKSTDVIIKRK